MTALDALRDRLDAAHTLAVGASIDSVYSHAAWAAELGGVSFPLLSDFHPKGAVAKSMGMYLADNGITDRATVIVDAGGIVRYAASVTPAGKRDMEALVRRCEELDAGYADLPAVAAAPGLPAGAVLYVRDDCMFSRWARYARTNLHLEDALPLANVSTDAAAATELQQRGGKAVAPALAHGDTVLYESADIASFLVECAAPRL